MTDTLLRLLLLRDVSERLPLWNSRIEAVDGTGYSVVTSSMREGDGRLKMKYFFLMEAMEQRFLTAAELKNIVGVIEHLSRSYQAAALAVFICFVDLGGTISYYSCETALSFSAERL